MKQHDNDWIFYDEQTICHFRVAGVLIKNNMLLVQKDKDNICAIPGGHVAFGEISENALIREFKEELGENILVNRLIWIEENFWKWGKRDAHNITFYYLISLMNDSDIQDTFNEPIKDNNDVSLQWVAFDELNELAVYPPFIKDKIENISDVIEHFIRSE